MLTLIDEIVSVGDWLDSREFINPFAHIRQGLVAFISFRHLYLTLFINVQNLAGLFLTRCDSLIFVLNAVK